jgi:hypothetical protein
MFCLHRKPITLFLVALNNLLDMLSVVSRRVAQQNVSAFVFRAMSTVPSTMKVSESGVTDAKTAMA